MTSVSESVHYVLRAIRKTLIIIMCCDLMPFNLQGTPARTDSWSSPSPLNGGQRRRKVCLRSQEERRRSLWGSQPSRSLICGCILAAGSPVCSRVCVCWSPVWWRSICARTPPAVRCCVCPRPPPRTTPSSIAKEDAHTLQSVICSVSAIWIHVAYICTKAVVLNWFDHGHIFFIWTKQIY